MVSGVRWKKKYNEIKAWRQITFGFMDLSGPKVFADKRVMARTRAIIRRLLKGSLSIKSMRRLLMGERDERESLMRDNNKTESSKIDLTKWQ